MIQIGTGFRGAEAKLQNVVGGIQGIIDQAMVGHYVGHVGNAAIGVSVQIFILVIVFVASVFSGMGVLVARFAGSNESDSVNRVVYQAFLTAVFMAVGILAPVGYFFAPWLLDMINAAPEVQAEALPFLRTMFVFSIGMLIFGFYHATALVLQRWLESRRPRRSKDAVDSPAFTLACGFGTFVFVALSFPLLVVPKAMLVQYYLSLLGIRG